MFGIGVPELLLIFLIILVLFGGKKLPQLSKNLGEALRELRKGIHDVVDEKPIRKKKKK